MCGHSPTFNYNYRYGYNVRVQHGCLRGRQSKDSGDHSQGSIRIRGTILREGQEGVSKQTRGDEWMGVCGRQSRRTLCKGWGEDYPQTNCGTVSGYNQTGGDVTTSSY